MRSLWCSRVQQFSLPRSWLHQTNSFCYEPHKFNQIAQTYEDTSSAFPTNTEVCTSNFVLEYFQKMVASHFVQLLRELNYGLGRQKYTVDGDGKTKVRVSSIQIRWKQLAHHITRGFFQIVAINFSEGRDATYEAKQWKLKDLASTVKRDWNRYS